MNRFAPPPRRLSAYLGVLVLLACAVVALALPSAAMASKCGDAVLQDWFDDGRIDSVYDLHCYEDAIDAIPADLRDYANAEDVISRALAAAQVDGDGPGGSGSEDPDRSAGVPGEESGDSEVTPGTDSTSSSDPSSIPIPLLLLGAMSLVLLGAGGLGYLSRRRNGATDGLVDDDPQP